MVFLNYQGVVIIYREGVVNGRGGNDVKKVFNPYFLHLPTHPPPINNDHSLIVYICSFILVILTGTEILIFPGMLMLSSAGLILVTTAYQVIFVDEGAAYLLYMTFGMCTRSLLRICQRSGLQGKLEDTFILSLTQMLPLFSPTL